MEWGGEGLISTPKELDRKKDRLGFAVQGVHGVLAPLRTPAWLGSATL